MNRREQERSFVIALAGVLVAVSTIASGALYALKSDNSSLDLFVALGLTSSVGVGVLLDHIRDTDDARFGYSLARSFLHRIKLYNYGYLLFVLTVIALYSIVQAAHRKFSPADIGVFLKCFHCRISGAGAVLLGLKMLTQEDKGVLFWGVVLITLLAWCTLEIAQVGSSIKYVFAV